MTSTTTFTADDARALVRENHPADMFVAEILEGVKTAAQEGKTSMKTYTCDFGSGNLYGGKPTAKQEAVMRQLAELGFKTKIQVECRQFVDIWLEVSWGENK